jgi:[ribosomal protein S18]-alanine N-acetyltransferase
MSLSAVKTEAKPRIFDATSADADALSRLHEELFPAAWSPDTFKNYCISPHYHVLKALSGETPAGLVVCQAILEEGEILTFGVLDEFRGRGLGTLLLRTALADLRDRGTRLIFLDVAETNAAARRLYEACGFRTIARREGYYRAHQARPLAALIMQLELR